jgi:hypothetical protein
MFTHRNLMGAKLQTCIDETNTTFVVFCELIFMNLFFVYVFINVKSRSVKQAYWCALWRIYARRCSSIIVFEKSAFMRVIRGFVAS